MKDVNTFHFYGAAISHSVTNSTYSVGSEYALVKMLIFDNF